MPNIIKSKAIALKKIDYGDTSQIVTFYTEEYGKLSAILKGARSPKSKLVHQIDILNYLEIVVYKKDTRQVQLVSQADLIKSYQKIKSDLNKLKYASGIIELLNTLTFENEANERLFTVTVKALDAMEEKNKLDENIFAKYLLFFLKEIGYEIQLEYCSECKTELSASESISFKFDRGLLCSSCATNYDATENLTKEHFLLLKCLISKNYCEKFSKNKIKKVITFLEKYLMYHIPEFRGIKSIHYY